VSHVLVVAQSVEALRYKPEGCGFDSWWCHWNFSSTCSFQPHCGHGVDSVSNRNEYQKYFVGGKGGRCVRLTTLPPSCAVLKSGSLYLLEPSGSVQVCNGIALSRVLKVMSWWSPLPRQQGIAVQKVRRSWRPRNIPMYRDDMIRGKKKCFTVITSILVVRCRLTSGTPRSI